MKTVTSRSRSWKSPGFTGHRHSESSRQKMSETRKKRYEDPTKHPMFGKKHSAETRAKISETNKGRIPWNKGKTGIFSEEHRAKMSAIVVELWKDPEFRSKMTGENHHMYGKTISEEHRGKMSASMTGENNPMKRQETRAKVSASWTPEKRAKLSEAKTGKTHSEEARAKISAAMSGENSPSWKGGISFEPYCYKFNHAKKEEIRNRDERFCQLCGKPEILNGEKLSVHHIDGSKTQGCSGEKWYLCALCRSCNSRADTLENEFLIVSNLSLINGGEISI